MNSIKQARIASGLTQCELARKSGVSLITIHRAEAGRNVSVPVLRRLAAALDTTLDELVQSADAELLSRKKDD